MKTRVPTFLERLITVVLVGLTATPSSLLAGQLAPTPPLSPQGNSRSRDALPLRDASTTHGVARIPEGSPPTQHDGFSARSHAAERTSVFRASAQGSSGVNATPSLSAISNQTVNVGQRLSVSVTASDPDLPSQTLQFSLFELPTNARISTIRGTNAVVGWTPGREHADTTNRFTVLVRDNGTPSLSATQSFEVVVTKFAQAKIGTVVTLTGQDTCLPITLDTSEPVTNINFTFAWPRGSLTNLTIHPLLPEICSSNIHVLSATQMVVSLYTCPGQSFTLTQAVEVAELCFTAISDESSFVPLTINSSVRTLNGVSVTNSVSQEGRVVEVADQCLLEAFYTSTGERQLSLYGRPGFVYQIESTTNLSDPPLWIPACKVPMTSPALQVCCADLTAPTIFYRAYEFGTGPTNQAPVVNAGPDQTIRTNTTLLLSSATDDQLPAGCKPLTYAWSSISGPGSVTFSSPTSAVTTAAFTVPGNYTLRLSVSDSQDSGVDDVNVSWDCFFSIPGDWLVTASPPNSPSTTQPGSVQFTNCEAILSEGGSFLVAMERVFGIPTGAGLLCITYDGPIFDTSDLQSMHDAFEVAVVDPVGRPLTFTIQGTAAITPASATAPAILPASPDALFNHAESQTAFVAPGAALQSSTLSVNVSQLDAGTPIRLILRLINNDNDSGGTVRLRDVRFKSSDPTLSLLGSPPFAFSLLLAADPIAAASQSQEANPCPTAPLAFSTGGQPVAGQSQSSTGPIISNAPVLPPAVIVNLPQNAASCTTAGILPLSGQAVASTPQVVTATNAFLQFAGFSNASQLKLSGSATITNTADGAVLRLCPTTAWQAGSAFTSNKVSASSFSTYFRFRITNPGGALLDCNTETGADGIVFVIKSGTSSLGDAGPGIGYAGIADSVGVEFDTFCNAANNDPNSNHLGINTGGNANHGTGAAFTASITPRFDDGNLWHAWIDYDGTNLEVRVNQTGYRPLSPNLSRATDIPTVIRSPDAYVGFTSGTGFDWGDHDIIAWQHNRSLSPILESVPNRIVWATVNGSPVQVLDEAGNFFALVDIRPGENVFDFVAADAFGQTTTNTVRIEGCNCPSSFATLGVVSASIQPEYARTTFNDWSKTLYADVSLRNKGNYPIRAPLYLGITRISDPTVSLLAPDGVGAEGIPYYDFSLAVTNSILNAGNSTSPRTLAFYNPNETRFTYEIAVLGQLNQAPQFTSLPIVETIGGRQYLYNSKATDPDGDPLAYSLLESPAGMSIESASGLISWTATNGLGTYAVRLRVDDGRQGTAEQTYFLNVIVAPSNRPPSFVSVPVILARVGSNYVYNAEALDPDGDTLNYSLTAPHGTMSIDPVTGRIEWTPGISDLGDHTATILVSDGRGGSDEQSYAFCVLPAEGNRAPMIVSQPITSFILQPYSPTNSLTLDMKVRDFNADFRDFEGIIDFRIITGIVQPALGQDNTPTYAHTANFGSVTSSNSFYRWFHDVQGSNITTVLPLTLNETPPASHIFTYTNLEFFPIDNQLFGNEGRNHNFHFTFEAHSTLTYRGGETIGVSGDDDSWIFINKQLVIDRGGVYPDESGTVKLDDLGLIPGDRYTFDLFSAERHTSGSYFRMSAPNLEAHRGEYSTEIAAMDPENDNLSYELVTGPTGMSINSTSGLVTWNPSTAELGTHAVGVRVTDSRGGTAEQTFTVTVTMPESSLISGIVFNDINTNAVQDASEPGLSDWIVFIDQNQNSRRDTGEPWLNTGSSGQYAFSNLVAGPYSVRLIAPDHWVPTSPANATSNVTLTNGHTRLTANFGMRQMTNAINSSPRFVSQPPSNLVPPGSVLLYQASATDGDGDPLTFDLVVAPSGMLVGTNSGLVAWQPALSQIGTHDVILRVQDGRGGVTLQSFNVTVRPNSPPVITTFPRTQAVVGMPFQYIIRAQDSDGDLLDFDLGSVTIRTTQYFDIAIGDSIMNGIPRPGAGNIETPYTRDVYTFTATAGQKVFFDLLEFSGTGMGDMRWKVTDNSGAVLLDLAFWQGDPPAMTMTRGGTYTLDVGTDTRTSTGTYGIKLWNVPSPNVFTMTIGGTVTNGSPSSGAGNIETAAAHDVYTFTATAGQKVFFDLLGFSGTDMGDMRWKVTDDSGAVLLDLAFWQGDPAPIAMTRGGTYTLDVGTDARTSIGTYGIKLWNVPAPSVFTTTIGGTVTNGSPAPGAGNIETIAAHDVYTFTATAGQRVYFDLLGFSGTEMGDMRWKLTDNSGAVLLDLAFWQGDPPTMTMTRGGTYTLDVGTDARISTGTYGFRLTNVAASALFAAPAEEKQTPALPADMQANAPQAHVDTEASPAPSSAPNNDTAVTNTATGITLTPFANNPQTPGRGGAVLSWTPSLTNAGATYRVEIIVRDSGGAETSQSFNLEVVAFAPNHTPVIGSTPRSSTRLGMVYGYQLSGTDADGDPIQYHLGACCLAPRSNQVAWWRAEGNALDSQGAYHGNLSNAVTFVSGQVGQAFHFSGTNFVSLGDVLDMGTSDFTIEAWIKGDPTMESWGRIIDKGFASGFALGRRSNTQKVGFEFRGSGSQGNNFSTTSDIIDGSWHHVAVVKSTNTVTIYADGVSQNSETVSTASQQNALPLFIGSNPGEGSVGRWKGEIDELSIYSRALAAADIEAIYNAGAVGKCTNSSPNSGPAGLVLDASGLLTWTPTPDQLGTHTIQICADDGRGGFASQIFTVNVSSTLSNQTPVIVSLPPSHATADQPYQYDLVASDPDNDSVTWRLVSGPVGMSVDADTGALRWTPTHEQLGTSSVTIEVQDVLLATAAQSWTIQVGCVNSPPQITSIPDTETHVGELYVYALSASDPDNDPLTFSFDDTNGIPAGMTLNAQPSTLNGNSAGALITWTPETNQVGSHLISVKVSDGRGGIDTQNYTLYVSDLHANRSPVIVSVPSFGAGVDRPYSYTVRGFDPDGDTLSLQLFRGHPGASLIPDPSTLNQAILTWTPTAADVGSQEFIITAQDPSAASTSQRFVVSVRSNTPPQIVSVPPTNGVPNLTYRYDVVVYDADGDPVTFALTGPSGMTIDSLGRIAWTPLQTGAQPVTVTVTDGFGGTAAQTFTIVVAPDLEPPSVSLAVSYNLQDAQGNLYVEAGTEVPVQVNASDNVGIATIELRIDGTPVPLNAGGAAMVPFPVAGSIEAIAHAVDTAGNLASVTNHIPVVDPNASNTVHVVIVSPTNTMEVTRPVDVIATITSEAPLSEYRVEYAEISLSDSTAEVAVSDPRLHYQTITNVVLPLNTAGLTNAVLARFDPTLLLNGGYIIRVTAYDQNRQGRQEGVFVNVTGNLKFGEFRIAFTDLTIPLAGIPITIQRVYDSRASARQGDFGYGWSLGIQDAHLLEVGKSQFSGLGGAGTTFTANTSVYMTTPDGRRVRFSFKPEFVGAAFLFGAFYKPAFEGDPGVYDKLEPLTADAAYQFDSRGRFTSLFGLSGYTPDGYRLKTKDNLTYVYDMESGLESVTDLNGNNLKFTRDGIFHYSAGTTNVDQSILFIRDSFGRITNILDPDRHPLTYTYDTSDDLRSFSDQVSNVTQYIYHAQRAHYLTNIIDPLGRNALRLEYDSAGRLVSIRDALDNVTSQEFPDPNTAVFSDANSHTNIVRFDDSGNEVMKAVPGISTNNFAYDANNNEIWHQNARGFVTTQAYDNRGNLTHIVDAHSNVTAIAYNDLNKPTSIMDPLGNTTQIYYNERGEPTNVVNALGEQSSFTRDVQGWDPLESTCRHASLSIL